MYTRIVSKCIINSIVSGAIENAVALGDPRRSQTLLQRGNLSGLGVEPRDGMLMRDKDVERGLSFNEQHQFGRDSIEV
jgi:hypothetical protein